MEIRREFYQKSSLTKFVESKLIVDFVFMVSLSGVSPAVVSLVFAVLV